MISITVFTTTYNRAYTLPKLYESLKDQTCQDFCWLIVDDGSIDNTKELVNTWINENLFPIYYIYQKNKGMLGGHNTAYDNITTELSICIDSDDYMPTDAIERILSFWREYGDNELAGFVGLDAYTNGNIIGTKFPVEAKKVYYHELFDIFKIKGDKKYIYRTDVINQYPRYPVDKFPGEKFPAQGYLYRLISQKYKIITTNQVFCFVEYLPDGNTNNKFKSYYKNCNAFAFYRQEMISLSKRYKDKFRHAIHYVSSCMFAKRKFFYGQYSLLIFSAIPFGILLNLYLKNKIK